MQGLSTRFVVAVVVILMVTASVMAVASVPKTAQAEDRLARFGVPSTVGLVLDKRGNLYAASRDTGDVYCLPPMSSPVLLARVPGTPTCLTIDRVHTVYVGTESGAVYSVTLDGSVAEAARLGTPAMGVVVDRDGGLLVATDEGVVVHVELERKRAGR